MEGALRVISVERGHDPADFTLVPFGGAAGLHAVELAGRLGIPRLLIPPDPGLLSALGMLVSPIRKDVGRTVLLRSDQAGDDAVAAVFDDLEATARSAMAEEGVPAHDLTVRRLADVRYAGQSFELTVPAQDWADAFHRAHADRYGFDRRQATLELVTARVQAVGPGLATPGGAATPATAGVVADRAVRFRGEAVQARAIARAGLDTGATIEGPAIIHEYSATFWLPPGWRAVVLETGALSARSA
jgi:N-methylhydantoinase A